MKNYIKHSGSDMLLGKLHSLRRNALTILHGVWAIPVVVLIRVAKSWFLVRLGTLTHHRMGHFAADAVQQWAALQEQPTNQVDLYWLESPTCNTAWEKMIRRNFPMLPGARILDRWNRVLPGGEVHHRPSSSTGSRDLSGVLWRQSTSLKFEAEEVEQSQAWLENLGWTKGEPFVCLLVRDDAFLDSCSFNSSRGAFSWDYHSYRNADINSYVSAMEWLADQGVWVFRMGKVMANPIRSTRPRIIDYAFRDDKSDLLDIWLFAHCDLCISTGSGPDLISDGYLRPTLLAHLTPIVHANSWANSTAAPKPLRWRESAKLLTFREQLAHSYLRTDDYDQAGIEILDLSADELLTIVQERWQRIQGAWEDTAEDKKKQAEFWRQFQAWPDFSKYHGYLHPESRLSSAFLRRYSEFLG